MSDLAHADPPLSMRLIIGLGNPGARYVETRHNLGFELVSCLARRWGVRLDSMECNALVVEHREVLLAAPQTFMNRSGFAARCLVERRGLELENLLIVYDDVALPFGRLRLRPRGGPGGHRGMESVISSLQSEEIPRLRLGIAPPTTMLDQADLVDFVLSPFSSEEAEVVPDLVERAADACEYWLEHGFERAMNRFN